MGVARNRSVLCWPSGLFVYLLVALLAPEKLS